jgi:cell division protein FtsQ
VRVIRDHDSTAGSEVLDELQRAFSPDAAPAPDPKPAPATDDDGDGDDEDDEDDDFVDDFDDDFHADLDADADADLDADESADAAASPPRSTIVIDDGGLPDPVYFGEDDTPVAIGERSTVVIDDDSPDGGGATRATRSTMDARVGQRRASVRKAAARRKLRWVLVVAAVVVVAVAALAVLGSGLFAVDEVDVEGAVYTDPARLGAIVDDLTGTPVLLVDTHDVEQQLEAIPWVESARVRTDFPDRVAIEIRERRPMATFQGSDQRYRVLDGDGRVLDVIDGQPIAYMLVTGPDQFVVDAGNFAPVGYAAASQLVSALPPSIRSRTASIWVVADGSDLRLQFGDGTLVRFGAADDLINKLVRLETALRTLAEGAPVEIDVSTNDVTVR